MDRRDDVRHCVAIMVRYLSHLHDTEMEVTEKFIELAGRVGVKRIPGETLASLIERVRLTQDDVSSPNEEAIRNAKPIYFGIPVIQKKRKII